MTAAATAAAPPETGTHCLDYKSLTLECDIGCWEATAIRIRCLAEVPVPHCNKVLAEIFRV
jgi:hypothetical protein